MSLEFSEMLHTFNIGKGLSVTQRALFNKITERFNEKNVHLYKAEKILQGPERQSDSLRLPECGDGGARTNPKEKFAGIQEICKTQIIAGAPEDGFIGENFAE